MILQIPATLQSFKAMSHRALRLVYDSQENLTDDQVSKITANHEKYGWLVFLPEERQITPDDIKDLPEIETDNYKSPSQRLRSIS